MISADLREGRMVIIGKARKLLVSAGAKYIQTNVEQLNVMRYSSGSKLNNNYINWSIQIHQLHKSTHLEADSPQQEDNVMKIMFYVCNIFEYNRFWWN